MLIKLIKLSNYLEDEGLSHESDMVKDIISENLSDSDDNESLQLLLKKLKEIPSESLEIILSELLRANEDLKDSVYLKVYTTNDKIGELA